MFYAIFVLIGLIGIIRSAEFNPVSGDDRSIAHIEINSEINPSTARFVRRSLGVAETEGSSIFIINMDTPGGLFDSTREIVEIISNSGIPVVVFVYPTGARAASAGTFIAAVAHITAMAPLTTIGAASPVGVSDELPDTLERKASQDAAALLREIASKRDRDVEALEATVFKAISYSATEALEAGIIDLMVDDMDSLIQQLEGLTIELDSGTVTLRLKNSTIREINRNPLEKFLGFLSNPNLAFTLLAIGFFGLLIEWILPGLWGPGILGVICLALGFVALGELPANWVGVGLMMFATLLFYLEVQISGFGIFGVSGAISFILGGFFLVGGLEPPPIPESEGLPSVKVNIFLLIGVAVVFTSILLILVKDIIKAKKLSVMYHDGKISLIGQEATVVSSLDPKGTVRVSGEDWTALSDSGERINKGEKVVVTDAEGLTLKVFKWNDEIVDA
tara:strand:- start:1407 stop:2756 length:1350 start_codon:yes stop_codon:yes gene_type:complete